MRKKCVWLLLCGLNGLAEVGNTGLGVIVDLASRAGVVDGLLVIERRNAGAIARAGNTGLDRHRDQTLSNGCATVILANCCSQDRGDSQVISFSTVTEFTQRGV